jgi:protein ImuB
MVVCVYLPRLELIVAAGGAGAVAGRALAVGPAVGTRASAVRIGQVSGAAEAQGVSEGMLLGEAIARCPQLELAPADPGAVQREWEGVLQALEATGAAVEPAGAGTCYLESEGLHRLHGGLDGVIAALRSALGRPARIGAGPTRLCALGAALEARPRRAVIVSGAEGRLWLAARPVALLGRDARTAVLVEPLGRAALADRFGPAGITAHRLACSQDGPLCPRPARETFSETLEIDEACSGQALGRLVELLVARLLARPERRGRTLRAVAISAALSAGGGWSERVVLREPLADRRRICLALAARLDLLPAPARELTLAVEAFGPPAGEQLALTGQDAAHRHQRLGEAIEQARAAAGRDAALRVLLLEPDSRVPERRALLTPASGL